MRAFSLKALLEKENASLSPPDETLYHGAMQNLFRRRDYPGVTQTFDRLLQSDLHPEKKTVHIYLAALCITKGVRAAMRIVRGMDALFGFTATADTYRTVIAASGKIGDYENAYRLFSDVQTEFGKNLLNYNALLQSLSESATFDTGSHDVARGADILDMITADGITPDFRTYTAMIRICSRAGMTKEALDYLQDCSSVKLGPDAYEAILWGLARRTVPDNELLSYMRTLLTHLISNLSTISPSLIEQAMAVFQKQNKIETAEQVFTEIGQNLSLNPEKTALAFLFYIEFLQKKMKKKTPSDVMKNLNGVLERCGKKWVVRFPMRAYRAWIGLCYEAGDYEKARQCWEELSRGRESADQTVIKLMMKFHLQNDRLKEALDLFLYMEIRNIRPTADHFQMALEFMEQRNDQNGVQQLKERMNRTNIDSK